MSTNSTENALPLLHRYVDTQMALILGMQEKFPDVANWDDPAALLDVPREGTIEIDNVAWSFRRHGAGFTFVAPSGTTIDAHKLLGTYPHAFDAWRLVEFFQSCGVSRVCYLGQNYPATDEGLSHLVQSLDLLEDVHVHLDDGVATLKRQAS